VGSLYYDYFHTGQLTEAHSYVVEGIGEDFLPTTIDFEYIDDVVRVNDKECMQITRRIVREEGIFGGGSSGAAVSGALRWVRRHDAEGLNVLVLLPDSGSRYLSKTFDDNWMRENGFMDPDDGMGTVGDLMRLRGEERQLITTRPGARVSEVVGTMKLHGVSQLPVVEDDKVLGIVTETALLERALRGGGGDSTVGELAQANFTTVEADSEITVVAALFKSSKVAIVVEEGKPIDILTRIDLIDYISSVAGRPSSTS